MLPYLAGFLVIGSVLALDPGGFAPFGPAKWTLITASTLVAAAVALRRGARVPIAMGVAWTVLLGWLALTSAFGVDPVHAWIGTPDRRFGWLAWLTCALAFVAGCGIDGERDQRILVRSGALAALAVGGYAFLETAGAAVDVSFANDRLGGPYGQPAYVGAAAALLVPIAAGLAFARDESRWWRIAGALGAATAGYALFASGTRGALVGLAVGSVLVLTRLRRPVLVVGLVAVLALVVVTPMGERLMSVFDDGGTGRGRVAEWQVATRAVGDDPFTGAGPEGYRVVFGAHVDAGYVREYGTAVFTDRAHSGVLDVAALGGLPALGAYLVLVASVVLAAWRARHAPTLVAGVAVGLVAYLVQQQLLFPIVEVDPVMWLFAGALVAPHVRTTLSANVVGAGALFVAAAVAFAYGAAEIAADRQLNVAVEAAQELDHERALAAADRATDYRPDSIRNWFVAARVAHAPGTIRAVDDALDRIEHGLDVSRRDPALRAEYGALLLERAERSRLPADAARAEAVLADLVADEPENPDHRELLAHARELAK